MRLLYPEVFSKLQFPHANEILIAPRSIVVIQVQFFEFNHAWIMHVKGEISLGHQTSSNSLCKLDRKAVAFTEHYLLTVTAM